MFEIGNSLREARLRRGVDFAQAELATKIRGKYLRALEDEQFELLPAQTYVKGFLRTYAEYLGLDGQLYVDEFNSRFVAGDDQDPSAAQVGGPSAAPEQTVGDEPRRRRARRDRDPHGDRVLRLEVEWGRRQHSGRAMERGRLPRRPQAPAPLLEVTALRGQTHLTVHTGSATGNIRFDGTIQQGDTPRVIRGSRLWVSISTPENLRIRVRGTLVHVPGRQPRVIIVTPTGWRPA